MALGRSALKSLLEVPMPWVTITLLPFETSGSIHQAYKVT
jgi:hypothetical protein